MPFLKKQEQKGIERRKSTRGEDAEVWTEDDRKRMQAIGPYIDRWNSRNGTSKPVEKKERHPLDVLLGVGGDE